MKTEQELFNEGFTQDYVDGYFAAREIFKVVVDALQYYADQLRGVRFVKVYVDQESREIPANDVAVKALEAWKNS